MKKTDQGEYSEQHVPLHTCTDEEFKNFSPPETHFKKRILELQEGRHWFCLDWRAYSYKLYGSWLVGGAYQALSVRLIPCAASLVTIDGTKLGGASENDDCVWD